MPTMTNYPPGWKESGSHSCSPESCTVRSLTTSRVGRQTPKEDLNSKLGMDLRRAMLLRLAFKDTQLYPEDPAKREKIYTKYKQFEIPAEEAEWVGLSVDEAVEKQRQLEHKEPEPLFKPEPLNHSWWRRSKGHFLRSTEVTSC
ncbi:hypothetical protein J4Q44_G00333860 [Coregonus suidteri]|uniref:39S ribosomal protein L28, mitochondrial n=1 Tax=Coregonus suidteri TaxID=861788 RepID=A0AAN8KPT2_9TELE